MRFRVRLSRIVALALLIISVSAPAFGQAFTPPAQVGSVTTAWQWVSNTGHRLSDGFLLPGGQSVTSSVLVEVDYGVTDRVSATGSIPYVFARYTGGLPPFSGLERDSCRCWHSSFQDVSVGARYRYGDEFWAITPQVRYTRPTHGYPFAGEAVVGRRLSEVQLSVNTAYRLVSVLPKANVQASYAYAVVEKPLADVSINRSQGFFDFGYAVSRTLFVRGGASWQVTHGGLRFGAPSGVPFFPPGEVNTPERFAQRDRLVNGQYWHAGAGVSYSTALVDLFVSVEKYLSGHDTHNGIAYTVGSTWYFDFSKPTP